MTRRVVVTGMAGISPLGNRWPEVFKNLKANKSAVQVMKDWKNLTGLLTCLGAPARKFPLPSHYVRQKIRTMGRVSLLAVRATEMALESAGLLGHSILTNGEMGIAYGSTTGSPPAVVDYFQHIYLNKNLKGLSPFPYIQMMSHTCATNLGQFFEIKGRIVPTCSACTSGSQGIGYGYEAVKYGLQKAMVVGGAEELHITDAIVFDILYATSTRNRSPKTVPRPFDESRDGLVIGEGAGTLILEELEHALSRKAEIFAEVAGYGTNSDGKHMTNPSSEGMEQAIRLSLKDAGADASQIGYVNAHGTATELGDIAETQATHRVFGERIPISTLKSYMGHTLGACGALEAWMTLEMMRENWFCPTLHLRRVDPRCGALAYIQGEGLHLKTDYVMSNNFAFGGVNTSLIFKRWKGR